MKLWLLRPNAYVPNQGYFYDVPTDDRWGYDSMYGVIVRAESEEMARKTASDVPGYEGRLVWLDVATTSCVELIASGNAGVIMRDFRAG